MRIAPILFAQSLAKQNKWDSTLKQWQVAPVFNVSGKILAFVYNFSIYKFRLKKKNRPGNKNPRSIPKKYFENPKDELRKNPESREFFKNPKDKNPTIKIS